MPFKIVRRQEIDYGEHGEQSRSDHLYVNLSETIAPLLKKLKGCPLSFMIAVGLHEGKIILGGADPLGVADISDTTGFSRRAVLYAADFLIANRYITDEYDPAGVRRFRPAGFIWFGGKRHTPSQSTNKPPSASSMQNLHTPNQKENAEGASEIAQGVCKKARGGMQKGANRAKNARSTVVVDVDNKDRSFQLKQHQQRTDPRVKRILEFIGVDGEFPETPFEIAREWLYWHKFYIAPSFTDPPAFTAKKLRRNPRATPPARESVTNRIHSDPHALDYVWSEDPMAEQSRPGEMEMEF